MSKQFLKSAKPAGVGSKVARKLLRKAGGKAAVKVLGGAL